MTPKKKLKAILAKPFKPIIIDEGATYPKFYGCGRYVPYSVQTSQIRHPNEQIYTWRKLAYPIPTNLVISFYYYIKWLIFRGARLPPKFYTKQNFVVYTSCPCCGEDLYPENI